MSNEDLLKARNDLCSLMQKCSDIARIIDQVCLTHCLFDGLNISNNTSLIDACGTFATNATKDSCFINLMSNCNESQKLRSFLMFGNDQCQPSPDDSLKATMNSQMPQCDFCEVFLKNNDHALTSSLSCPSPKEDDKFQIVLSIL